MPGIAEALRNRKLLVIILVIAVLAGSYGVIVMTAKKPKIVLVETSMGNFQIQLYEYMPVTAGNFEKLVRQGFYDNTVFHRVIRDFMIQGGDPLGTGYGGPGYSIPDEFSANNSNDRGTIAMANSGPNTGGSQFFINVVNNSHLNTKHPVFGIVISGMEIVDRISNVMTDYNDRPMSEVRIIRATMISG